MTMSMIWTGGELLYIAILIKDNDLSHTEKFLLLLGSLWTSFMLTIIVYRLCQNSKIVFIWYFSVYNSANLCCYVLSIILQV